MTDPSSRRHKARRGAAAVEFAFAISVLLLIIFASIEFVRLNMMNHAVGHASYLAARKGIVVGANVNDVKDVADQHLALFGIGCAKITVMPNPITDETDIIEVTIDAPVSGNSWVSPLYFGGNLVGRTRLLADRAAAQMSGALPEATLSGTELEGI